MTEEGTVSIIRRGPCYQVRYASNNPYDRERQPRACPDEDHLRALLHHLGIDETTIAQACADVCKGGMAVLRLVVSAEHMQGIFRPAPACLALRGTPAQL
jgi:hypothetical protein